MPTQTPQTPLLARTARATSRSFGAMEIAAPVNSTNEHGVTAVSREKSDQKAPVAQRETFLPPSRQQKKSGSCYRVLSCGMIACISAAGGVVVIGLSVLVVTGSFPDLLSSIVYQSNDWCAAFHSKNPAALDSYSGCYLDSNCGDDAFGSKTGSQTVHVNAGDTVIIKPVYGPDGSCLSTNSSCNSKQVVPDEGLTCVTYITDGGSAQVTTTYVVSGVTPKKPAANETNQTTAEVIAYTTDKKLSNVSILRGVAAPSTPEANSALRFAH